MELGECQGCSPFLVCIAPSPTHTHIEGVQLIQLWSVSQSSCFRVGSHLVELTIKKRLALQDILYPDPPLPPFPGCYEVGHHTSIASLPWCSCWETTQAHSDQVKWPCTKPETQSKSFLHLNSFLRKLSQPWKADSGKLEPSPAPVPGSPMSLNQSKKMQLGLNLSVDLTKRHGVRLMQF